MNQSSAQPADELIRTVLTTSRTIAIVGASPRPERDSYRVMKSLIQCGYEVYPVNPVAAQDEILGRRVYASLAELPVQVDLVDVFRRSAVAGAVCDEAIEHGAKAIWMQLGVVDDAGAERARRKAGEVLRRAQEACGLKPRETKRK